MMDDDYDYDDETEYNVNTQNRFHQPLFHLTKACMNVLYFWSYDIVGVVSGYSNTSNCNLTSFQRIFFNPINSHPQVAVVMSHPNISCCWTSSTNSSTSFTFLTILSYSKGYPSVSKWLSIWQLIRTDAANQSMEYRRLNCGKWLNVFIYIFSKRIV